MRNPTPVTISNITAESGSESSPKLMERLPEVNQSQGTTSETRWAAPTPSIEKKSARASANATSTTPQPITEMTTRGSMRPKRPSTTKPTSGASRMYGVRFSIATLALQRVQLVNVHVVARAEDRDDDRQPHHHLCCGHRQHQKDEHPALNRVEEVGEGDEREVDGVEHQLDGHKHDQWIAPDDDACRADGEEDGADRQIGRKWHGFSTPLRRSVAPTPPRPAQRSPVARLSPRKGTSSRGRAPARTPAYSPRWPPASPGWPRRSPSHQPPACP